LEVEDPRDGNKGRGELEGNGKLEDMEGMDGRYRMKLRNIWKIWKRWERRNIRKEGYGVENNGESIGRQVVKG
jgi:hypothetical protein